VGSTVDLKRRLEQHNQGEVSSTRKHKPYQLIYSEKFEDKEIAFKRERFFKTGKGREVLRNLVKI
jgi:putative endonuclease